IVPNNRCSLERSDSVNIELKCSQAAKSKSPARAPPRHQAMRATLNIACQRRDPQMALQFVILTIPPDRMPDRQPTDIDAPALSHDSAGWSVASRAAFQPDFPAAFPAHRAEWR